jgi:hypothetical protein
MVWSFAKRKALRLGVDHAFTAVGAEEAEDFARRRAEQEN